MESKLLKKYDNGNVNVEIYEDGTRIMDIPDGEDMKLDMPLSVDLNISNRCENGCAFCYQNCTKEGEVADFSKMDYLYDMVEGSEIAINLQFPLPEGLEDWLTNMRTLGVIVNATVNQLDLQNHGRFNKIEWLQREGLITGLGISYRDEWLMNQLLGCHFGNIVIHMINGVHSIEEILKVSQKGFNVLVLGYKTVGKGVEFEKGNKDLEQILLRNKLRAGELVLKAGGIISFDNLSITQLDMKQVVSSKVWDECYQGEEGTSSFYVNGVDNTFALNSLVEQKDMMKRDGKTISEMFEKVKSL